MHIFYLQALQPEIIDNGYAAMSDSFNYRVVAISTPRLPEYPLKLGACLSGSQVMSLVHNGFQVVLQPHYYNESDYFAGRKREIHIAPGYRVKRDTIPHQILPQPQPVRKVDKEPDVVETPARRPWWHFGLW
jgi:hypothetical protein